MTYRLAQISDVHLTREGTLRGGFDPRRNLDSVFAALEKINEHGWVPDVFLFTGDLTNEGGAEEYRELARLVSESPVCAAAATLFVPGNHDARSEFRSNLLGSTPSDAPINQTIDCNGLRVIGIDSSVPGEEYGFLTEETLEFLERELASSTPSGTVIVVHHPPIPSPITSMATISLRNSKQLADCIDGTDVLTILCGHNHHAMAGALGGVAVWSAPSTAFHADLSSLESFRAQTGCALSLIEIDEDGVRASAVNLLT